MPIKKAIDNNNPVYRYVSQGLLNISISGWENLCKRGIMGSRCRKENTGNVLVVTTVIALVEEDKVMAVRIMMEGEGLGLEQKLETLIETDDSEIGKEGQYISQEGEGGKGEDSDGKHGLDGDGEDDLCKEEGGGGDDSGGGGDDSGGGGNGDTINGNKSHKLKQK